VIVGAGLGGLATAIRLAAAGRDVTGSAGIFKNAETE